MTIKLNWGGLAYSLRRYFIDEFHFRHVSTLPVGSQVLDLGGNRIRKRGQFNIERYDLKVVYANLSTSKRPNVQGDAANIPFKNGSFDAVICSELLEHVPDPLAVLHEVYRILRDEGTLFICVPFLTQIHGDPYDYGRYTDFYWQKNLSEMEFHIVALERQGLFWSVLMDMVRAYVCDGLMNGNIAKRLVRNGIMPGVIAFGKRLALKLDTKPQKHKSLFFSSFTTGFGIVATKR
jgi:SAM-dependent methyltransferase